ncbi:serine/arginine repetitive matrix protein 1-like [Etheostoma cragini]|uniref:serine/arginine repetitive matrix protein 1-like n=1 Tax=Etheostoma cragini TaxID=417921 RepID=UPI00155E0703|nr:serine/arginine repetitive matrix protein 1-like [Etheostoma cragini]
MLSDTLPPCRKRRRAERSPSVEIIYEGTVAATPPAAKRRRRPRRHARLSSSPVIITLDSDSSHDDGGGGNNNDGSGGGGSASSSPLSSQQTVDFSDLPPLPPLHSAAADADLARLPVRILHRGSDGADGSDVDVENVDSRSPPGSPAEHHEGDAEAARGETKAADRRDDATAAAGNDPGAPNSDSRLLATILDDLAGIAAPKTDAPFNFEPQLYDPPGERRYDAIGERRWGGDSPPRRSSARPPPLERPKESGFGEEAEDATPRPYDRNTLPPLRHKHAVGLNPSPFTPHAHVGVNSHADLNSNLRKLRSTCAAAPAGGGLSPADADLCSAEARGESQDIPPISTRKRHFTSALALRGEPASAGGVPADDAHSHARFSPGDSRPKAPFRVKTPSTGVRSPSHDPPADSRASSARLLFGEELLPRRRRPSGALRRPPKCPSGVPRRPPKRPSRAPRRPPKRPSRAPRRPPKCPSGAPHRPPKCPSGAPHRPPKRPSGAPHRPPKRPSGVPRRPPKRPSGVPRRRPHFHKCFLGAPIGKRRRSLRSSPQRRFIRRSLAALRPAIAGSRRRFVALYCDS